MYDVYLDAAKEMLVELDLERIENAAMEVMKNSSDTFYSCEKKIGELYEKYPMLIGIVEGSAKYEGITLTKEMEEALAEIYFCNLQIINELKSYYYVQGYKKGRQSAELRKK